LCSRQKTYHFTRFIDTIAIGITPTARKSG
jgi:hypothetical protein